MGCTLGLLYDMTAEEAFARVKGYGCELREPAVDHSTLSDHEGAMGGFRWLLVEAEVHRIKTAPPSHNHHGLRTAVTQWRRRLRRPRQPVGDKKCNCGLRPACGWIASFSATVRREWR